jgi:DNA repair ATPase RecN
MFTSSDVKILDDRGRLLEMARMLSGLESSSAAKANAQELIHLARVVP